MQQSLISWQSAAKLVHCVPLATTYDGTIVNQGPLRENNLRIKRNIFRPFTSKFIKIILDENIQDEMQIRGPWDCRIESHRAAKKFADA